MQSENQLIEDLTGKSPIRETSTDSWAEILAEYPAFSLGHYFLAKKQGMAKSEQAVTARQTAARHFNDIRWLDYLLKTAAPPQSEKQQVVITPTTTQVTGTKDVQETAKEGLIPIASEKLPDISTSNVEPPTVAVGAVPASSPNTDQPAADNSADNSRLSAVLSAQLADFKKPVDQDARLEVQRDPLYKVDYFASQGVSILVGQDGFDRKVRKFTDWLKEMKQQNIDPAAPKLNTTPQEEAQAAQKAAASLKSEPIWTESMAEVLLSQGKAAQARSVYQKLSLLYPEKSAYFATKIDLLQ